MNIRESFERVGFIPEEKMDLTARLERAAELEENMTDATKRKIKKISTGMIFGIAAAVMMTAGALAAVLSPGPRTWFDTTTPGASQALEDGIYRLDRSETYNGWTVSLGECVGDDNSVYIWVDLTAPKDRVLALPEGGYFKNGYDFLFREKPDSGSDLIPLPDGDPGDNHMSFLMEQRAYSRDRLRGETVDIVIRPFVDCWWTDFGTEQAEYHEGSPMTEGIQDHQWSFQDVKLDYPDQTICLEPESELACLGGTAVLTRLEVSPLSVRIHLEGGGCAYYLDCLDRLHPDHLKQRHGSVTVSSPDPAVLAEIDRMDEELAVEVWLKDGTRLTSTSVIHETQGARPDGTPYLERSYRYDQTDEYGLPTWAIDPAQVDHVVVCGVEIPVIPSPAE